MYPNKVVFQGYEWNVPGHEHCSFGTFVDQFKANDNVNALVEFEYRFDANDKDTVGGIAQGWTGKNYTNNHAKALEALTWLQTNHRLTSWTVFAHPERKPQASGGYKISDFRDFNDAAPDVVFGFESVPGHQMGAERGGYGKTAVGGGTYGGSGYFSAKVGGLWDAMLSEGRHFWLFSNSDCHDTTTETGSDFFPGEYQKNNTFVSDVKNPQSIVDGMRSGNNWVVNGDLIDSLTFKAGNATMGATETIDGNTINITIKIHDPQVPNYNVWTTYNNPTVDHVDLIAGKLGEKIAKTDAAYGVDTVTTTSVIARFDAVGNITDSKGIKSQKWNDLGNGSKEMTIQVPLNSNMYFRLRGTNLGLNVANETDGAGNPLPDTLVGGFATNTRAKAFADLWFYSNPIFVKSSKFTSVKSLNEIETKNYTISPNPAENSLFIDAQKDAKISIFDIDGKLQIESQIQISRNQIDISFLKNGAYFILINDAQGAYSDKFIKQ